MLRSVRGMTLTEAGTALLAHADALASRLTVAEPSEALDLVTAGDADLAVIFTYSESGGASGVSAPAGAPRPGAAHGGDLIALPLLQDPVRVVLSKDHRLARRSRSVALADLAGERWIAGCPRCEEKLLTITEAAGFRPDIRHRTDDYVVAQRLVAEGLAVTLLPGLALLAAPVDGVVTLPVRGSAAPKRQVSVLVRAELMESAAVVAAVEVLREVAAGLS